MATVAPVSVEIAMIEENIERLQRLRAPDESPRKDAPCPACGVAHTKGATDPTSIAKALSVEWECMAKEIADLRRINKNLREMMKGRK